MGFIALGLLVLVILKGDMMQYEGLYDLPEGYMAQ